MSEFKDKKSGFDRHAKEEFKSVSGGKANKNTASKLHLENLKQGVKQMPKMTKRQKKG